MKKMQMGLVSCAAALALLLTGCKSASSGSMSGSTSASMGGVTASSGTSSSSGSAASGTKAGWRTGLGMVSKAKTSDRNAELNTAAAAVLLDRDGRIVQAVIDEIKTEISADGSGAVRLPDGSPTKREKGDSYPLAAVSSIGKSWSEQADFLAEYLIGMTEKEVRALAVDENGYAEDADLKAGCTISIDRYQEAVLRACGAAKTEGAAQGDRLAVGMSAEKADDSRDASDDADGITGLNITAAAVTMDSKGRVTSAFCDAAEPRLTVVSDGLFNEMEESRTKQEQGDAYGLRKVSGIGREWYEQSEGFANHIQGKNASQVAGLASGSENTDLSAVCTISVTELKKAVVKALEQEKELTNAAGSTARRR